MLDVQLDRQIGKEGEKSRHSKQARLLAYSLPPALTLFLRRIAFLFCLMERLPAGGQKLLGVLNIECQHLACIN